MMAVEVLKEKITTLEAIIHQWATRMFKLNTIRVRNVI